MSFTWDWLLWSMIGTHKILHYYQIALAQKHTDMILYTLGRDRGVIIGQCHIIKRTSEHCYRIMSYLGNTVEYCTCRSADDICNVLLNYIPKEYTVPDDLLNRNYAKDGALSELSKVKGDKAEELKQESLYQIMRTLPDKGKNK